MKGTVLFTVTMKWSIIITLVLTGGSVLAEIDSPLPTSLQNLNFGNLPGNLSVPGNLPVNISKVPTLEEGEKLLEQKCKKMGHPEAYEAAQGAKDEVQKCVKSLVNVTELQQEMELAKPTGDLDVVFRKYCRKSPDLQYCITNFTSTLEPCLDPQEKESKHLIQNITDSIIKFICFKEGDRIALFIAEGGPECLQSNQDAIQECVNKTIAKNLPQQELSVENLPAFVFGEEQCRDMRTMQTCIVNSLSGCDEPTPANIVDSMFNFVRKMTPCHEKYEAKPSTGSTGTASITTATVITVFIPLLLSVIGSISLH